MSNTAIVWYKSLSINQRINLKQITFEICGMRWDDFNILFTPSERIEIIYQKLKLENII